MAKRWKEMTFEEKVIVIHSNTSILIDIQDGDYDDQQDDIKDALDRNEAREMSQHDLR